MSAAALLCATALARADVPLPEAWRIWLEPRFMHPQVSSPVPGAEKTVYAAGSFSDGALEAIPKSDFSRLDRQWDEFAAQARLNAASELAQITPVYVRNKKKIIEYAELHSDKPILASAVLAPGFRALFQDTLGPDVLVAIPNQNTAYVFPKLASNYRDFAPMILRAYRETSHPVSLEVFEVTAEGLRAIGAYADPARN